MNSGPAQKSISGFANTNSDSDNNTNIQSLNTNSDQIQSNQSNQSNQFNEPSQSTQANLNTESLNQINNSKIESNNSNNGTDKDLNKSENEPIDLSDVKHQDVDEKQRHKNKNGNSSFMLKIIMITLIFFILLFSSIGTVIGLAAYEKIKIPNPAIQNSIIYLVQGIPFMPKTPKYVLIKSVMAHSEVSSARIDASVTAQSDDIKNIFGIDDINLSLAGPVDYNNKNNPQIEMDIKLNSDFDADFKLKDKVAYYKINKIPEYATSILGFTMQENQNEPITSRWVSYDIPTPNPNEANDSEPVLTEESAEKIIEAKLSNFIMEELIPLMKMSKDTVDEHNTFLLTLNIDESKWIKLENELRSIYGSPEMYSAYAENDLFFLNNAKLSLWIDRDDYLVRKLAFELNASSDYQNQLNVLGAKSVLGAKIDTTQLGLSDPDANQFQLNFDLKLSEFDNTFEIETPMNTVDSEQYLSEVTSFIQATEEYYYNDYGPVGPIYPEMSGSEPNQELNSGGSNFLEEDSTVPDNEIPIETKSGDTEIDEELMDGINPL